MASPTFLRVLAVAAVPALAVPTNAEQTASREVSQALPSAEVEELRNALQRLARQPQSAQALVDAGDASLALDDYSAAEGFYARALQISPSSAAAKLGLASVFLKTRQPVEALQMFAEAERAGASVDAILGDWGLAQDLVGNNELAQQSYRAFLAKEQDDEVTRRLAISQAIAGQRDAFEATLRPLLTRQDLAAFRARAFGLAILGDTDQAARLANQLLPPDLSSRMAPYFEFMPRLTKSQQAAAANLGIFPRAAEIGRDDPQMASLGRGEDPRIARFDQRLAARGTPLGTRVDTSSPEPSGESRLARIAREQASVADAFSGFIAPEELPAAASDGAVDISTIEIPREQSKPEPPQHPSRHWVQMATGRDIGALRFDWRRMMRRAPELLDGREAYSTPWGQANRLLTGPFASRDEARQLVRELRQQGFDSFSYTSAEGEKINIIQ